MMDENTMMKWQELSKALFGLECNIVGFLETNDRLHPAYAQEIETWLHAVDRINGLVLVLEPMESVDAYLRSQGYDPDALSERIRARVKRLLDKRREELAAAQLHNDGVC